MMAARVVQNSLLKPHLFHFSCVEIKLIDPLVSTSSHQHVLLVFFRVKHTTVVQLAGVQSGDHLHNMK